MAWMSPAGGAFAEHLLDGVSGDEVDQQEDGRDYQPDYREGVEDALEKLAGHRVVSRQFSVVSVSSLSSSHPSELGQGAV